MAFFNDFIESLSNIILIDKKLLSVIVATIIVLCIFSIIKKVLQLFINKKMTGRKEFLTNQFMHVLINFIEILALLSIWSSSIKNIMTLISVVSAAMTIALRELIVNFFCGIYIKIKRPSLGGQ